MNSVKGINFKNRKHYYFDDIINIKTIDPNKIKIEEKSYKNIFIQHSVYVIVKYLSYAIINSVNPLYLVINEVNGYIEESNTHKYLTLMARKAR